MLVDTSVWVDFLNGHDSVEAVRLTHAIENGEPVALPAVVIMEILLGLKSEREAARIADLLSAFDVIAEPTLLDYQRAAALYRRCRKAGFTIRSTLDCVIAQLAIRDQLPMLTKDRDFAAIARHSSLQLLSLT